jgi:hypothetical protein
MNRVLLTLLLVLFLVLFPTSPLVAADEGEAENVAPVIEESSFIMQIINTDGIAWEWSADGTPNPGDRTVPYILDGEQLHIEVEVTDANGEVDLAGMEVYILLVPGAYFTATLASITIDPDTGMSRGLYIGEATAEETIPSGKADIEIEVYDLAGAGDIYDPVIYEPEADILKPDLSLEISAPSVIFPQSIPGDLGITANSNPIQLTPQAVIGTEHIPVVFSLSHYGTDMVCGENVIPVSSIVWSTTPEITDNSLSGESQIIASDVPEGTVINVYYWLNVPTPQADGTYNGLIDFQFIAD